MRWTKEEKLKMVLEYKKNGFTPTVEGCSRKTMYNNTRKWTRVYDLYGECGFARQNKVLIFGQKKKIINKRYIYEE